jgi:hypothetical protein
VVTVRRRAFSNDYWHCFNIIQLFSSFKYIKTLTLTYVPLIKRRSEFPTVRSRARTYLACSIYAVGGENNTGIKLASVERYDSAVNRWVQVHIEAIPPSPLSTCVIFLAFLWFLNFIMCSCSFSVARTSG